MISIIIPLYNKERTIRTTINSILSQDFANYEIIIVNDGSTDDGPKIIENIKSEKIIIIHQNNKGPSAARNAGVNKAKGDWVIFLDADDYFEPNALSHYNNLIRTEKRCNFFCCNYYILNDKNKYLYSKNYKKGYVRNNFFAWCSGLCMPRAGAAMYKRELLLTTPFKDHLHRYEDAENIFALMRKEPIYRSPVPVMTYYCDTNTASLPCNDIKHDFIGNLQFKGKTFWEQYSLFQLYKQGLELYPNKMQELYNLTLFQKVKFKIAAITIGRMKKYHII